MSGRAIIEAAVEQGRGVLRLLPAWVPRSFCRPGRRIKLHPNDYYALGLMRGGIDERWLASATHAENGPGTPSDEGMSYVESDAGRVLLLDVIEHLREEALGAKVWQRYGRLPMYSKFFDNMGPLPHHIHHDDTHAARVGQAGKPEMYFFPSQMNNHLGEFPFTFFGLSPEITRDQVRKALEDFPKGDNHITALSRAYKLTLDTGWNVPPGVLHAPGSLCTYEPQFASDVFAMYQSVLPNGQCVGEELLWKDSPPEEQGNIEYLLDVIDWDINLSPGFYGDAFMAPIPAHGEGEMKEGGYSLEWICYRCQNAGAQRLTVRPGQSVTLCDDFAYGLILVQGRGKVGVHNAQTPTLIRFGEATQDEFFVTYAAAQGGVCFANESQSEDLVLLRHFSPGDAIKNLAV